MRIQAWWMVLVVLSACSLDSGDGSNRGGSGGISGSGGTAGVAGLGGSGSGGFAAIGGIGGFSGSGPIGGFGGGIAVDAGSSGVCTLRFDPGPCEAAFPVFAFVPELGACYPHTYGGCEGNGNRFDTARDCEIQCSEGEFGGACPPDRASTEICVECGPAGGCAAAVVACAPGCMVDSDCPITSAGPVPCFNGICQPFPCD